MPNAIAYVMLAIWPVVCLVLFRRLPLERALIWSLLAGYLFLPPLAEVNLPLVPAMDKVSIPNVSVLLILLFGMQQKVRLLPEGRLAKGLVAVYILCAIPTVMTNSEPILFNVLEGSDPILFVTDFLPGQSIRDIGSVLIGQILTLVPFLLARQFLSSENALREMLLALMVGALIYSVPSLIEIRLSPQINIWVYGFFQHSFEQTMRGGGFRPIVFLPHSLWLALFVCTALIAAVALFRTAEGPKRVKAFAICVYLFVLLLLCKSAASIAYGLLLVPVVLLVPARIQVRLAAVLAIVALTYPMVRNFNLIPLDTVVERAAEISGPDRAHSLNFRFVNEQQLLARAAEKPLFGWGGWGRNLIRHPETGEILSIPDGRWIIVFGTFGWVGYLAEFGLLALPLLLMGKYVARRGRDAKLSPYIGPLTLILGATMMDMLLNATLTPITWLIAGAVLGHVEKLDPRKVRKWRNRLLTTPVMSGRSATSGRTTF